MAKERGLTDYLNDWNVPDQGGDSRKSASGAGSEGTDNERAGVPFSWDMPPSPDWGMQTKEKDDGGYGHSDDVKDTGTKSSAWSMSKEDQARGYENLKSDGEGGVLETRQAGGSFEQSIPDKNVHDRGAGSDSYAREHSATTGRGFDGRGKPESTGNPGGETIGSSKLPY
jgi:hypothetical protein